MKWIVREQQREESAFNAGSKARTDVDQILVSEGFTPIVANLKLDTSQNMIKKLCLQFLRYQEWKACARNFSRGDTVVIQYPVRNHTIFFAGVLRELYRRGVNLICIIHDLESIRQAIDNAIPTTSKLRFQMEEVSALKFFSRIIVHNAHMSTAIHESFKIPKDKMINLEIFDYLYQPESQEEKASQNGPVLVAGNLDRRKSAYVYHLPADVPVELFGSNYDATLQESENVIYRGMAKPDDLPGLLKGSFGLVWDGSSAVTCEGVYGEYLKLNNPHKTSLYLASGLPVIVWDQSAIADFVRAHDCGIIVSSLDTLYSSLKSLSAEDYARIRRGAEAVGAQLRAGEFTKAAVKASLNNWN